MRTFSLLIRTDRHQAGYLFRASCYLWCAWIEFNLRPMKVIIEDLQGDPRSTVASLEPKCSLQPATMGWAISVAARYLPWRSDCMVQAIAAVRWLRRIDRTPTFHIGVVRRGIGAIEAHAWVLLDGNNVVGGNAETLEGFTLIQGLPSGT